jgi:hypothetical protein
VLDEGQELRQQLDAIDAKVAEGGDKEAAIVEYRAILDHKVTGPEGDSLESLQRVKEDSLYRLAKTYAELRQFPAVMELLRSANPYFATIPKVSHCQNLLYIPDYLPGLRFSLLALP